MVGLTSMLLLIGILDVIQTNGARWTMGAITVIWAFVYFFSIGAMAFVILGETSAPSLRAPTASCATAVQGIMGLIMNLAIPYVVNPDEAKLKGKVGFVFGGLTGWTILYVPELKGHTFEEIDRMFQVRVSPRNMGSEVHI